jgi:small multidrug resistance family-3 protein
VASVVSLLIFAWLLAFHPAASGRVYAAYGGVYITTALLWLWRVDGVAPDRWDMIGGAFCIAGMLVIYFGPRGG